MQRKMRNTLLDVRLILDQIDREPRADVTNIKKQLAAALNNYPSLVQQLEELNTLRQVYGLGKEVIEELKINIQIEKEY